MWGGYFFTSLLGIKTWTALIIFWDSLVRNSSFPLPWMLLLGTSVISFTLSQPVVWWKYPWSHYFGSFSEPGSVWWWATQFQFYGGDWLQVGGRNTCFRIFLWMTEDRRRWRGASASSSLFQFLAAKNNTCRWAVYIHKRHLIMTKHTHARTHILKARTTHVSSPLSYLSADATKESRTRSPYRFSPIKQQQSADTTLIFMCGSAIEPRGECIRRCQG